MNKSKIFDRYQILITIIGLSALLVAVIMFVVMLFTATPIYDENHILTDLKYNYVIQMVFTIFYLGHLIALLWFVTRLLTYKLRMKEEDAL